MLPTRPVTSLSPSITRFGPVEQYVCVFPSKAGTTHKIATDDGDNHLMIDDFLAWVVRRYMLDALQIVRIPLLGEVRKHPITEERTMIVWHPIANWNRFKQMAARAVSPEQVNKWIMAV